MLTEIIISEDTNQQIIFVTAFVSVSVSVSSFIVFYFKALVQMHTTYK